MLGDAASRSWCASKPRAAPAGAREGDLIFTNNDGGLSLVTGAERGNRPCHRRSVSCDCRSEGGELSHLFPTFVPGGSHLVDLRPRGVGGPTGPVPGRDRGRHANTSGRSGGQRRPRWRINCIYANDDALISQTLNVAERRLIGALAVLRRPRWTQPARTPAGRGRRRHARVQRADRLAAGAGLVLPRGRSARHGRLTRRHLERAHRAGRRRVAATVLDPLLRTLDVVAFDGRSLMPSRISLSIDADEWPVWSPDGLRVAWVQAGHAVMIRGAGAVLPADGAGRASTSGYASATGRPTARTWWCRGRWPDAREDLWLVPVRGGGAPRAVVATPFSDVQGVVSPDGRWIAYASDESGAVGRVRAAAHGPLPWARHTRACVERRGQRSTMESQWPGTVLPPRKGDPRCHAGIRKGTERRGRDVHVV